MCRAIFSSGTNNFPLRVLLATLLMGFLQLAQAVDLPDLVVTDIAMDNECRFSITVKNQGKGGVPQSAYQAPGGATVAFYKDNAGYGGWGLNSIDPQQQLMTPGASVTWHRPSEKLSGSATIGVAVDAYPGKVAESNENNNSLSKNFSCTPQLPDLRINSITFTNDCRNQIVIENAGDAPVPNSVLSQSGGYLQRFLDGKLAGQVRFDLLDPTRSMQPPGGSKTWTDGSQYRASSTVKYQLNKVGQEWNTANNTLQVSVPSQCQVAVEPDPDLVVTNIALDSNCRLVVTLSNQGGPMPLSAYDPLGSPSINFYKDGASFGGWNLPTLDPQQTLRTAGASVTWTRQHPQLADGTYSIRVNVDAASELVESNENNNDTTQIVICGDPGPGTGTGGSGDTGTGGGTSPDTETGGGTPPGGTGTTGSTLVKPDLAITRLSFSRDCKPQLKLENLGGPLDRKLFRRVYLQRFEDKRPTRRIPISVIDRKGMLHKGRSVEWTDGSPLRARKTLSYQIASIAEDANAGNNKKKVNVPANCRGARGVLPKPRTMQPAPLKPSPMRPGVPSPAPVKPGAAPSKSLPAVQVPQQQMPASPALPAVQLEGETQGMGQRMR